AQAMAKALRQSIAHLAHHTARHGERLHLTATVASVMALDEDEDHLLKRLNYALAQAKSRKACQA
ncbi:MAG: GGDEF domain-containing protein, partial [Pseudomonas putida]